MDDSTLEFESIHDAFRPKIQRYLTRLVGAQEAEDLTQEVFCKVNLALKTFRGECALSTWIYRIATNAAIDRIRTASFRRQAWTSSLDDPTVTEGKVAPAEELPSLEQWLLREERHTCFGNFVEKLPANYRAVYVLCDLEELTNQQAAEVLGLSLEAVKIRLHRGRARLLQELRTHCQAEDWL